MEKQAERFSTAIKIVLQIFGLLGAIGTLIYATMEFYIQTVQNDENLKKEISVKNEEIKEIKESLKDSEKDRKEMNRKINRIYSDIKFIRAILEFKKSKPVATASTEEKKSVN